ncbi:hypothetical protein [Roseimaritima ulvae]|uniref:Uncharacterized protein n=1 Tax=Roseimaritima ulvae TaxID=980254 RepID=A0A5B9QWQ6_9BACT|nr:hypothetical protein [Roseimaritima ulvae]QEG42339.1 hypothetical protein UC8_43730 [Roseimaritima ulvae]
MSSPRDASPCEAVIVHVDSAAAAASNAAATEADRLQQSSLAEEPRHGQLRDAGRLHGGPLRLPRQQQAEFVQQFNQLYRALGMRLEVLKSAGGAETVSDQP